MAFSFVIAVFCCLYANAVSRKPMWTFISRIINIWSIIRFCFFVYFNRLFHVPVKNQLSVIKHDASCTKLANRIHIMAVIYVERDSQKGIVIGKGGSALKKVGTLARKDIEVFFDKKVFLELYVKVEKDWRSRENKLKGFGYIPE